MTICNKPSSIFKSISNFTNGFYYNIESLQCLKQLLLQKYLLNLQERKNLKYESSEIAYNKCINCNSCQVPSERLFLIIDKKEGKNKRILIT